MKKLSLAYIGIFTAIVLGFLALRHTAFVTSSPTLSRFASLNATELKGEGRSFVWPMALKGVKEHPILGWGQDNFNYVFNKYYDPAMYRLEPWFDRAHNIFLDWATQGGLLGLLAYLSLYYVLLRAMWKTDKFDAADKAVLTGLVAAYFFHNIFVFDHLVSYILFASLLAFVDSRTEAETVLEGKTFTETSVQNIGGPVALVALVIVMYFINVHPIIANASLISALQNLGLGNPQVAVQSLEKSYAAARLGRPEVVEQIASNSAQILSSSLSTEEKNAFFTFAQSAIEKQAAELPTDARYQLLAGSFFNTTGYFDKAAAYLDRAQELSPGKQMIYFERATVSINAGDYAKGLSMLKSAYELDTKNADAEVAYLVGAIFAGNRGLEEDLKADINAKNPALFNDDRIINAYLAKNRFADVIALFASRLANNPNDPQSYVNLAAAYLKAENKSGAITTLEKLGNNLPQYKTTADDYIAQIKNGTLK